MPPLARTGNVSGERNELRDEGVERFPCEHVSTGASTLRDETVRAVVKRPPCLVQGTHLVKDE
jgi:hypothetical protein